MGFRENNSNWKGGRYLQQGRPMVLDYDHPRSHPNGYVLEHILIAEKALEKPIPEKVDIHHVNGDRANNSKGNLVICQDRAYHALLHRRTNALIASRNPNWRKCLYCKQWDDPQNMYVNHHYAYHRICKNQYQKKERAQIAIVQDGCLSQNICGSLPHSIKNDSHNTSIFDRLRKFFIGDSTYS